MGAIDRIYQYFNFKGIKPTVFEAENGFSSGYFSSRKRKEGGLSESSINKLISLCPDMNPIWFITGKGKMTLLEDQKALKNSLVQENLRLKKELKDAYTAVDVFLKRKGIFNHEVEELKERFSGHEGRLQEIEDKVFPDN